MNNEIIIKIIDDLNHKMRCCLNGNLTATQCWHYADGVDRTIRTIVNSEDFDVVLRLLHSFMRVMEYLMKNE